MYPTGQPYIWKLFEQSAKWWRYYDDQKGNLQLRDQEGRVPLF